MDVSAPTEAATRLAVIIGHLNRRLRSATGGLSHALLSTLASVAKHGPIRLADLAQLEQVSAPGITRLVAELEARELVVRSSDPEDGRVVLVEVTDAGAAAIAHARAARAAVTDELLLVLEPQELAAVEAALPALERVIGAG